MHHFIICFTVRVWAIFALEQHILMDGDHGTYFLRLGLRNLLKQGLGVQSLPLQAIN